MYILPEKHHFGQVWGCSVHVWNVALGRNSWKSI